MPNQLNKQFTDQACELKSNAAAFYPRYIYFLFYFFVLFYFCLFYLPYLSTIYKKRIVSLCFGRNVRTRLGDAIFEMSGPPLFHIKVGASR